MNTFKKRIKELRWWWKALLGAFLMLLMVVSIVIINIDSMAHTQINKLLKSTLSDGGTLDAIDVQLAKGRVEINGLTINSPQGFSTPLLRLETLVLDVNVGSLLDDERVVEKVVLKDLSVVVMRNGDGKLNLPAMGSPGKTEAEAVSESGESEPSLPSIRINAIRFENIRVAIIDQLSEQHWSTELRLDLAVDDLQLRDVMKTDILSGKIELALREFKADQPPGFGSRALASLERLEITSDGLNLGAPEMVIEQILIKAPSLSPVVLNDSESNWQRLARLLVGSAEEPGMFRPLMETMMGQQGKADEPTTKEASSEASDETAPPVIVVRKTRLEGGSLRYQDASLAKEPIVLPITDVQLEVTEMRLFDTNIEAPPASVSGSLALGQHHENPTAYLGLVGSLGQVGLGVPLTNSQIRVTGFKLDTLGSLVPPGTKKALGATGMDADLSLAMNTDSVNLRASILTDKHVRYNAINVKGPLQQPKVTMDQIFAGVASRVTSGVVGLGKDGVKAGLDMASGGVDVAKEVGGGVKEAGKSLAKGVGETTVGLVTLDKEKTKEGLTDATVGTAAATADSAKGVGSAAGEGVKSSYSDLTGNARVEAWNKDIPARHEAAMQRAQSALTNMPYPPETE